METALDQHVIYIYTHSIIDRLVLYQYIHKVTVSTLVWIIVYSEWYMLWFSSAPWIQSITRFLLTFEHAIFVIRIRNTFAAPGFTISMIPVKSLSFSNSHRASFGRDSVVFRKIIMETAYFRATSDVRNTILEILINFYGFIVYRSRKCAAVKRR
jgi:hypothetical protein